MTDKALPRLGVYVHWPFCAAKCPYCDFNSHVRAEVDQKRWAKALCTELTWMAGQTGAARVDSIFFGGGTPSLMTPATVAAVIDKIATLWTVSPALEITLEANPTSVEASKFQGFATAGVNRVSIGVQALNDTDLRALGRLHSVNEAKAAFDVARRTFDRVSFDLIYARQHQTLSDWQSELTEALGMAVDHLSLYQLTIEDGTAFGARHATGGLKGLPKEGLAVDLYTLTQDLCGAAGLPAYEVSNHARRGAESQHNLIYWRGQAFAGVGPGAHSRIGPSGQRRAVTTERVPERWLTAVESRGHGLTEDTPLSSEVEAEEYLMMSLRLSEGTDVIRFQDLMGRAIDSGVLGDLRDEGLLQISDDRIVATDRGILLLNSVLRELLS